MVEEGLQHWKDRWVTGWVEELSRSSLLSFVLSRFYLVSWTHQLLLLYIMAAICLKTSGSFCSCVHQTSPLGGVYFLSLVLRGVPLYLPRFHV